MPAVESYRSETRLVPMRVIVCGVQRTGTLSMQHALFRLGVYDCYHMVSFSENCTRDADQWIRALEAKFEGKGTFGKKDWDKLLGNYQAVCDQPSTFFGPELAEVYPEAKVIILNRDPEKWYNSVLASIYAALPVGSPLFMLGKLYCLLLDNEAKSIVKYFQLQGKIAQPYDHGKEKDKALDWFHSQYKEYRDRIPAERRLEFTMGDGWKPLCDFLGVPIPMDMDEDGNMVEAPFPRLNDKQSFHEHSDITWARSAQRATENLLKLVGKTSIAGVAGLAGYMAVKTAVSAYTGM